MSKPEEMTNEQLLDVLMKVRHAAIDLSGKWDEVRFADIYGEILKRMAGAADVEKLAREIADSIQEQLHDGLSLNEEHAVIQAVLRRSLQPPLPQSRTSALEEACKRKCYLCRQGDVPVLIPQSGAYLHSDSFQECPETGSWPFTCDAADIRKGNALAEPPPPAKEKA